MSDKVNGLSEKQFLGLLSSRLKEVLNPTIYNINNNQNEEPSVYFILQTDITDNTKQIGFFLEGTGIDGVIKFVGHFSDDVTVAQSYYGLNNGTSLINGFGFKFIDGKLNILIKTQFASTLAAEVFLFDGTDNKNHCTDIVKGSSIDETSWHVQPFYGDSGVNFSFGVVDKNGDTTIIDQYSQSSETSITSISEANTANKLASDIPITVTSPDNTVSGEGIITTSSNTPTATLQLQASVTMPDVPVATLNTVGGVRLALQQELPNEKCFPVKLTTSLQAPNKAYVDLSSLEIEYRDLDKHRYTDMGEATREHAVGDIVEYIGESANGYVKGYFYMLVNQRLIGTLPIPCNWYVITPSYQDVLNLGLSNLYLESDWQLSIEDGLTITLLEESGSDESSEDDELIFTLTSGDYQTQMTYSDIQSMFGIQLYGTATSYDLHINLSADPEASMWVQKDVQPTVKLQSDLSYKGILQAYSDLANVQNPQTGDYYTITELDNAEYFYDGTAWALMGPELYLSYQAGDNIAIDGNVIKAKGYLFDPTKQSIKTGGNTSASGLGSHAEGWRSVASGHSAHAEGGDFGSTLNVGGLASGDASHAEGYLTQATGIAAHAEGHGWTEGNTNCAYITASGSGAHAEGACVDDTAGIIASGTGSHAEGYVWNGYYTTASGAGAHAEGCATTASGQHSHAEGSHTIAQNTSEHAQGRWNNSHRETTMSDNDVVEVPEHCTKHSIGIGTGSADRKNAVEVMGNGDVYITGVGNYTGTDIKPTAGVKTLQEVLQSIPQDQEQSDWNQTNTSAVDYIKNKPQLSTVATSGSYNDLTNKPTIPAAQVQADWNQTNIASADYIRNKIKPRDWHILLNTTFAYDSTDHTYSVTGIDDSNLSAGIYFCAIDYSNSGFILEHFPSWKQIITFPGGMAQSYGVPNGYNLYRDWDSNNSTWGDWILDEVDYATNSNIGMVKLGYNQTGKNYPLSLDSSNRAYVEVPWEDHSDSATILVSPEAFSGHNFNGLFTVSSNTTIQLQGSNSPKFMEVTYLFKNGGSSDITISMSGISGTEVVNMSGIAGTITLSPNEYCEIVFTCWSSTVVTYNYGISI